MGGGTRLLLCCSAALLLGGCGSSGYAPTTLQTVTPAVRTLAGFTPGAGTHASAIVRMQRVSFLPHRVTIRVGQTAEWVNRDNVVHNVTTVDGHTIVSPNLGPGGRFAFTARVPETIRYYCTIHSSAMIATLVVTQ